MPDFKEHSLSVLKPVPANRRPSVPSSPMISPAAGIPLSPYSKQQLSQFDLNDYHKLSLPPSIATHPTSPILSSNGNALDTQCNLLMQHPDSNIDICLSVPAYEIEIDHNDLMAGVATVIDSVFPEWQVDQDVRLVQCTNGITNKLVKCTHIPTGNSVLVRTYGRGSSVLIDRGQELVNMLVLSRRDMCPPLYARFTNGIVYGFTEGEVFTVSDMSDRHKSQEVAKHLAIWHNVTLPIDRVPRLFHTLWRWIDAIPQTYSNSAKAEKFRSSGVTLDYLRSDLLILQKHLESLNNPVVFCHCDLLSGNIIYSPTRDCVSFIDYEYGCYSYRGFDIANHFCEWAGFDCDWSLYPTEQQQKAWLSTYWAQSFYIASLNNTLPINISNDSTTTTGAKFTFQQSKNVKAPTEEQLNALYKETLKFSLAAHFFWAVWALIQAEVSDLDFDYLDYAMLRLNEYNRRKEKWLAL
ncbi:hypothetical protein BATDEDRAFT_89060 [Batrachochytrium dendrobatidis JAM81]|uniref:ethanolamine kinase n=2 Tax=Batrachochytrium dendrobatidis TaxID=109871 RepID=F4P499_BATDJ|nr:uncharacterized protein BATDEDRAFT_89060 [Batrachochytrium dendrobatidis JAM81]EGF79672.1 hypothetical protein BATDEDRAFT_89060 [Batrachochytrium dendrobatidis JAM81]KAK5673122.1 hypothetical protein QVD99_000581 [Batrachochytrium dendrobatidis]OAJ38752.1 hypothetical protein BDEG_22657 [Batrachochytrium dendrobatidis JEL423]|eukprot:XP_006679636.1 hypothetical protein BATDEDRAFT_89060 [Batrachochytrium dendrobatidis JAM81]